MFERGWGMDSRVEHVERVEWLMKGVAADAIWL